MGGLIIGMVVLVGMDGMEGVDRDRTKTWERNKWVG